MRTACEQPLSPPSRLGNSGLVDKSHTTIIDHIEGIQEVFDGPEGFASLNLSSATDIRHLSISQGQNAATKIKKVALNDEKLDYITSSELDSSTRLNLFFINRSLIKSKLAPVPEEAAKLKISKASLELLISRLSIPLAFVFNVARYYLPSGKGFRTRISNNATVYDYWYLLPIRTQVTCTSPDSSHDSSNRKGRSQMNPFYYLHLPTHKVDIRGSQIALCFQYNTVKKTTTVVAVNFIDGRWPKVVEEPQKRIQGVLEASSDLISTKDPFFIHIVYLSSMMKWWTNALHTINEQLIVYEQQLQDDSMGPADQDKHQELNKVLHAMAAHLHRYASELTSTEFTIENLETWHRYIHEKHPSDNEGEYQEIEQNFSQVASQLQSIMCFEQELEKKIQNILALLFNRIQLANDQRLVANGIAMQRIMEATQEETRTSRVLAIRAHELTEEMKKDSLSMKTIAILTMFFLPGTSFAALLAMPFFASNTWLSKTSRFWVWVVLTVPSTGLAFAFYLYWRYRGEHRRRKRATGFELEEIGGRLSGEDAGRT